MTYFHTPVSISDHQNQIIIGTILGGSSLTKPKKGKNYHLMMRGGNPYWLDYKVLELRELCSPNSYLCERKTKYVRWHSYSFPIFTEMRQWFYSEDGSRKIEMKVLDKLRDIGLCIWYLDCGWVEKGQVHINTTLHGEQGSETICRYFNEISLPAEIKQVAKSKRIILTRLASQKLLSFIVKKTPKFMLPRLTEGIKPKKIKVAYFVL